MNAEQKDQKSAEQKSQKSAEQKSQKSAEQKSHRTQIIIALISLVAALGGALLANWDKVFPHSNERVADPAPPTPNRPLKDGTVSLASQEDTEVNPPAKGGAVQHSLRSEPTILSDEGMFAMLRANGFSMPGQQITGRFPHEYRSRTIDGDAVVIDDVTALMWQQSGSPNTMILDDAKEYVEQLNRRRLAGYSDWRLPTLEELASLVGPTQRQGDLSIDAHFGPVQRWCWSADRRSADYGFGIVFYEGSVYRPSIKFPYYVRAVRPHAP
jgi:hypothetical protein